MCLAAVIFLICTFRALSKCRVREIVHDLARLRGYLYTCSDSREASEGRY